MKKNNIKSLISLIALSFLSAAGNPVSPCCCICENGTALIADHFQRPCRPLVATTVGGALCAAGAYCLALNTCPASAPWILGATGAGAGLLASPSAAGCCCPKCAEGTAIACSATCITCYVSCCANCASLMIPGHTNNADNILADYFAARAQSSGNAVQSIQPNSLVAPAQIGMDSVAPAQVGMDRVATASLRQSGATADHRQTIETLPPPPGTLPRSAAGVQLEEGI